MFFLWKKVVLVMRVKRGGCRKALMATHVWGGRVELWMVTDKSCLVLMTALGPMVIIRHSRFNFSEAVGQ